MRARGQPVESNRCKNGASRMTAGMPVPRQVAALSRVGVDRSIDEYASHALGGGVCPPSSRAVGRRARAAAQPMPPWRRQSAWTVAIWAGFPFTHRQICRIGVKRRAPEADLSAWRLRHAQRRAT